MSKKNKIILTVLVFFAGATGGIFLSRSGLLPTGADNSWSDIGGGNAQPGDQTVPQKTRKISLYYYNQQKDKEMDPSICCSRDAVLPVEREIGRTETPIQDAINLLLKGELTDSEKSAGFRTEFPLQGLSLKGANLANGVLTLEFDDKLNKTGGGSCRVGLLWAQIEKTAKQFTGVESVQFKPDALFQP